MVQLVLHPGSRCTAVARIDVDVARPRPGAIELRYVATGKIAGIRLPRLIAPRRADELWKHTCFEAFVRSSSGAAYHEFNFAPSTEWAAYRFTNYREGMANVDLPAPPAIEIETLHDKFTLHAALELTLPAGEIWRLALAAVIEETNGDKSYWALRHPPGKPDFHHADCFDLELAPPSRP